MSTRGLVAALAVASAILIGLAGTGPASATPSAVTASPDTGAAIRSTTTGAVTVFMVTPNKKKISLPGIPVHLVDSRGYDVGDGRTNSAGRITFSRVPAGTYTVRALAWPGKYLDHVRTGVTVEAGHHNFVVAVMRLGGVISGRAQIASGADLSNALVVARGRSTATVVTTTTNNAGEYTLVGLPTDSYSIQFNARPDLTTDSSSSYDWSFWGDEPAQPGLLHYIWVTEERGPVAESHTTGVDGTVHEGVTLSGIIRPQGTTNFKNATVHVLGESVGASFLTKVDKYGGGFGTVLVAGNYKFMVIGKSPTGQELFYWYAGENKPPTLKASEASTVRFAATAPRTIMFSRGAAG